MDLLRSEKMNFIRLIIPVESAQRAVTYLGDLGVIQFEDLNADKSPFQQTFVNQVKRCAEASRKLQVFKDQVNKASLVSSGPPPQQTNINLEELEIQLAEHENELEMNANSEKLWQTYNELLEFKLVLLKAGGLLVSAHSDASAQEIELDENVYSKEDYRENASLLEREMQPEPSHNIGLRFVSGIIFKSKASTFERMLFRATRGNMFFNKAPADEKVTDQISAQMVWHLSFIEFLITFLHG